MVFSEEAIEKTYLCLGAVSMCWSPRPKGVFDSTAAAKYGAELLAFLEMEIKGRVTQDGVIKEVMEERSYRDGLWGEQNHAPADWLMILMEEVGEAAKGALENRFLYPGNAGLGEYRAELIQVAAVAVAMVESLDRNQKNQDNGEK